MKGYVSLVLLLSIGFCAKAADSTTTAITTQESSSRAMTETTTTQETTTPNTTETTTTQETTTPNTIETTTTQETTTPNTTETTTTQETTTPNTIETSMTQEITTPSTTETTTTQETTTPTTTETITTQETTTPTMTETTTTQETTTPTTTETITTQETTTPTMIETTTTQETTTPTTTETTTTQETTTPTMTETTTTQKTTTPTTTETTTTQETTTPTTTASTLPTTAIATITQVTSASTTTALTTTTATTTLLDSTTQVSSFSTMTGTVSSTTPTPMTQSPPPCANKPCVSSIAECINLYESYICLCPYSFYYTPSGCQEGKVFPGQLTLNATYTENMIIVNSPDYKELYINVTDFFNTTFQTETSYHETKIVNVKQTLANPRIQSRAVASGINVTVTNVFELTTTLNASEVTKLILAAIERNPNFFSYYEFTPCLVYGCDDTTTTCNDTSRVPVCECKPGLSKKNAADKTCSDCESTCSEENHMHCITNKNSTPDCKCLPDFNKKDGKCVTCNLGYSGVDCKNNSLLILIIVAVLCGVLILGLVAGLICNSMRSKKLKNPEKRHLIKEDYSGGKEKLGPMSVSNPAAKHRIFPTVPTSGSNPAAKDRIFPTVPTSGSNPAAKDRIFPTVQTNSAGQVNRGFPISNPYEIASPMTTLPERDYEDDDDEEEEYEMSLRGNSRLHYRY